ncbi:cellulose binding domain-containing protein [Luedemannella helvata]|uniref:CBM2 domain-containing protein n=1 Tax=Luedemannella helvata TaxID=349315 RepID=A0ABN2JSQ9_9ACTN
MLKRPAVPAVGAALATVLAFFTIMFAQAAQAGNAVPVMASVDTTPPSVPTGLSVSVNCNRDVSVRWTASTDDVGVVNYDVYRSNSGIVATTTSTTYADRISGVMVQYQVRARDAAGNVSDYSAAVTAYIPGCPVPTSAGPTTAAVDTTPPSVPTGLWVSISCTLDVSVGWTAATDNVGVTGYDVYRASGNSSFALIATMAGTTYAERMPTGGLVQYQVRARDAAGNVSAFTSPVTGYIPPCPPPSSAPVSPSANTQSCTATYSVGNSWPGGFQGQVTVTNRGTTATTGWTVTLTFPNGQQITQVWGGRTTSTASPYTVTNETYNGVLVPNASVTFGFIGTWTGSNGAATVACARTP